MPRRAVCGAALFDVPGGIAELGQHELHAPELTLRAEAVLAEDLHLLVEALLLERAARLLEPLHRKKAQIHFMLPLNIPLETMRGITI